MESRMSNESPRDLYEKLGKKLFAKQKESEDKAKEKLESFIRDNIQDSAFLLPELKQRLLELRNVGWLDSSKIEQQIQKKTLWKKKKEYYTNLTMDFFSFCLNWTRLELKSFVLDEKTYLEFIKFHPKWKNVTKKELKEILEMFLELGFAEGSIDQGLLFENLDNSKDIKKVLLLFDRQGKASKSDILNKLKWNQEKLNRILDILTNQQIIIEDDKDNDIIWLLSPLT